MTTYIILSRFSPEAFDDPKKFKELAAEVSAKIKKQCSDVTWKGSFATLAGCGKIDSQRVFLSVSHRESCQTVGFSMVV
ncbi:MAG: hypothetical protein WAN76_19250 [Candidatus Sulfotelmatobacter sp.]